ATGLGGAVGVRHALARGLSLRVDAGADAGGPSLLLALGELEEGAPRREARRTCFAGALRDPIVQRAAGVRARIVLEREAAREVPEVVSLRRVEPLHRPVLVGGLEARLAARVRHQVSPGLALRRIGER